MKFLPVLLAAVLVCSLPSCKKKEGPSEEHCTVDNSRLLRRAQLTGPNAIDTGWLNFNYDAAFKLVSTSVPGHSAFFQYPDANTILHVQGLQTLATLFNAAGQVESILEYRGQDTALIDERIFRYNSAGEIVTSIHNQRQKAQNYTIGYTDSSTFAWTGGNLTRFDYYQFQQHDYTLFEYDTAISGRQIQGGAPVLLDMMNLFINRPGSNILLTKHAAKGATLYYENGAPNITYDIASIVDNRQRIVYEKVTTSYVQNGIPVVTSFVRLFEYGCNVPE